MRIVYLAAGWVFTALGIAGVILPLVPGVLFFILAAICFARSNPVWEAKIMEHPKIGPPVRAFRERGVIAPLAKFGAVIGMAVSSIGALFVIDSPWCYVPGAVCVLCAAYVLSRPSK